MVTWPSRASQNPELRPWLSTNAYRQRPLPQSSSASPPQWNPENPGLGPGTKN